MLHDIFLALTQNATLLLAMAFVYNLVTSRYRLGPRPLIEVAIGVMLGILGIILILSPWTYCRGSSSTPARCCSVSPIFFSAPYRPRWPW